jgi:hypothetical protein
LNNKLFFCIRQLQGIFSEGGVPHHRPTKTWSCRKKNRRKRVAFSLPQDSSAALMFELCGNRRPQLSTSRGADFRAEQYRAQPRFDFECAASD